MVGRRDLLRRSGAAVAGAIGATVVGNGVASAGGERNSGQRTSFASPPKARALLVLDRSGSMVSLRDAVVESINAFLSDQAREAPNLEIGLMQFDTAGSSGLDVTETFDFTPASLCRRLTLDDYQPRGTTPLLAAVAHAINRMEKVTRPADKSLLVVQTDGFENSSPREITKQVIADLIAAKKAEGNWTFVFLGADIDAWGEAASMNVSLGNTAGYANTFAGTSSVYARVSQATTSWSIGGLKSTDSFFGNDASQVGDVVNVTGTADTPLLIDVPTTTGSGVVWSTQRAELIDPPDNNKKNPRRA
jgi:hypothetical protein